MNGRRLALAAVVMACGLLVIATSTLPGLARPLDLVPHLESPDDEDGTTTEGSVDGYLALAPRVLRSGQTETVSVSLFSGSSPASATVQASLTKDGSEVAGSTGFVAGRGELELSVPRLSEGDYELRVSGSGFQTTSQVRVEDGTLVFLESDKPIYKPGQTVHLRVLTLDPQLKPVSTPISLEIADAKGLKVFKKDVTADEYGMVSVDMPLSTEPNLGVWKATAKSGKRTAQLDLRIERYVLPKYEVKIDLSKDWILASDTIAGTVSAEYSYGKPVDGEVEIKATRYVGSWQEFASLTRSLEGSAEFELPAPGYVSGVPASGGMGNVQIDVIVREKSTGYEEKSSRLLTVSSTPENLKLVPDSVSFKPGLPLSLLVISESPDKKPLDSNVTVNVQYTKSDFKTTSETRKVAVSQGRGMMDLTPPADAVSFTAVATSERSSRTSLVMQSGYSPTGSFIHLRQVGESQLKVGDRAQFHVSATKEAPHFYYEVVSRGKMVFSDVSDSPDISFDVTPNMAPTGRILVYQILPNSEVAADYLPFAVAASYPQSVQAAFDRAEARPGEQVTVSVQGQGDARVGLAAVDRSVFILAENRLNLQQLFDELETLYKKPQAELHSATPYGTVPTRGAKEVFGDAGLVVMTNRDVPAGKEYEDTRRLQRAVGAVPEAIPAPMAAAPAATSAPAAAVQKDASAGGLMEVQRVRQFFPETWVWDTLSSDGSGRVAKQYDVPDSITTWMLRAVSLSRSSGLGMAEAQLKVMQPFFVTVDLPYSAIRGEQFPIKVALYNYQETTEEFVVEIEQLDWFRLQDQASKTVTVGPNDLGSASFTISPTGLGTKKVKITARSKSSSDAIVKELIVEPEGVARESVENAVVSAGSNRTMEMGVPDGVIDGSARAYLAVTGNYLTQTLEGLENLIRMPYGCGEQNMVLFAPNVFVARYLKETGQMKPEVMAKAEMMMVTGYQRELTYRRTDGSYSAFGNQDKDGSLWLTAFVMKTFAQAKDLIYVDDVAQASAKAWIAKQQKADGSFDPVGFVHHESLLGGLKGKTALTAYLAVALREAGDEAASSRAIGYLEKAIDGTEDVYGVALGTYALELAKSPKAGAAYNKLMGMAKASDQGLSWGDNPVVPLPVVPAAPGILPRPVPPQGQNASAAVETTGYALLALIEHGDRVNAGSAARWLVSKRNAFGGYESTQDTVVGLQALTRYAAESKADVDATVVLKKDGWRQEVRVNPENVDVLQLVEVPVGGQLLAEVVGRGQVVMQGVRRYNIPAPDASQPVFDIKVNYGAGEIEVNNLIDISATVKFTPPEELKAGMVVVDVAVPTGFAAETDTLDAMLKAQPKLKRYDVSGRKVIVYIEDMAPGETVSFAFKARALYPVKAQAVTSQAYSYYRPEWKGEALGGNMSVR